MRRCPCLLLVVLLACLAAANANELLYGTVQIVAVHGKDEKAKGMTSHEHELNLVTKDGKTTRLLFPGEVPSNLPKTGTPVMVRTMPLDRCTTNFVSGAPVCVGSLMANEAAPVDQFAYGQPKGKMTIKTIVFLLQICNSPAATDAGSLSQVLFSDVAGAAPYTLQGMFSQCSYGMANASRAAGGRVVQQVVPIPCSGVTAGGRSFDSSTCAYSEWADWVDDYARNKLGIEFSKYTHKVYVIPKGDTCSWGGLGYVGCSAPYCRIWVSGDLWDSPAAYFHEIGHNMYLNHAGTKGVQGYDDLSGAMGFCCDVRCFNAPHLYQLGWASALGTLYKDNFGAGKWLTYSLPAAVTASRHFVKIRPNWGTSGNNYNLFISYRKTVGYDSGMATGAFGNRVIVYSTLSNDPQPYSSYETGLTAGNRWVETRLGTNLVVKVKGFRGNFADVSLCRKSQAKETSCGDGLDNDCDGLIDMADPDCQNTATS